jgi:hypothetical protein
MKDLRRIRQEGWEDILRDAFLCQDLPEALCQGLFGNGLEGIHEEGTQFLCHHPAEAVEEFGIIKGFPFCVILLASVLESAQEQRGAQ